MRRQVWDCGDNVQWMVELLILKGPSPFLWYDWYFFYMTILLMRNLFLLKVLFLDVNFGLSHDLDCFMLQPTWRIGASVSWLLHRLGTCSFPTSRKRVFHTGPIVALHIFLPRHLVSSLFVGHVQSLVVCSKGLSRLQSLLPSLL